MAALRDDLGRWITSWWGHWKLIVTSGGIAIGLLALSITASQSVLRWAAGVVLALGLLTGQFKAWRDLSNERDDVARELEASRSDARPVLTLHPHIVAGKTLRIEVRNPTNGSSVSGIKVLTAKLGYESPHFAPWVRVDLTGDTRQLSPGDNEKADVLRVVTGKISFLSRKRDSNAIVPLRRKRDAPFQFFIRVTSPEIRPVASYEARISAEGGLEVVSL